MPLTMMTYSQFSDETIDAMLDDVTSVLNGCQNDPDVHNAWVNAIGFLQKLQHRLLLESGNRKSVIRLKPDIGKILGRTNTGLYRYECPFCGHQTGWSVPVTNLTCGDCGKEYRIPGSI